MALVVLPTPPLSPVKVIDQGRLLLDVWMFGNPAMRMFYRLATRMSRCPDIWMSKRLECRMVALLDVWISTNPLYSMCQGEKPRVESAA
jgi:hypothetical protein